MIRRSILNMRSEKLIARLLFVNRYTSMDVLRRLTNNVERVTSFLSAPQIRPFQAEDNLDGKGDRAEAHADQDRAPYRCVQHVQDPLGQVSAEGNEIFSERDTARHDNHRRNEQHRCLTAPPEVNKH